MKKKNTIILAVIIAVIAFIAVLFFVNNPISEVIKENINLPGEVSGENTGETAQEKEESSQGKTVKNTLLIYMVGSDLEARSGAGTEDLTELEASGIDLENANVLIYTGGSPRWHNDIVSAEKNMVLELMGSGFKAVKSMDCHSMGTSESLTEFLSYSYENYPSEKYALILWDHGNGPIIGYGKDMLFDNDSMTLAEMRDGLKNSPFGPSNKLDWIGFDACLMSSAELACVLDNYADYLVASQEIEPSFGWNYTIMGNFGKMGTEKFLSRLIDEYIAACEKYYEDRGYDDRDTTLSCIKLSYAGELETAINGLFEKASGDVSSKYNTLVQKRVLTRALGRASTGSEYDIIDLFDMATQLESVYPEEAGKIAETVKKMVIKNGTNAEGLYGLSIYYPFYNKYYFENGWSQTYKNLNTFESYGNYLDSYQNIWLGDEKFMEYATKLTPKANDGDAGRGGGLLVPGGEGVYTLELTPEQNENYADAKFYVLEQKAKGLYLPIISSESVENENGTLTAKFSGKAIHVMSDYGESTIPMMAEYDTVGDVARYSTFCLGQTKGNPESTTIDINLSLNNKTEKVNMTSMIPWEENSSSLELTGGKREETHMEDWDILGFGWTGYRYLTRYDSGVIKPIGDWIEKSYFTYWPMPRKDGIGFELLPIGEGKYYLIFQITDTQNNKYCSELLPITVAKGDFPPPKILPPEELTVDWNDGEKVKLFEVSGVTAFLKKAVKYNNLTYVIEVKNENDFPVYVVLDKVVFNDGHYEEILTGIQVEQHSVNESYRGILPETAAKLGKVDEVTSILGNFTVFDTTDDSILVKDQKVKVNVGGEASLGALSETYEKIEVLGTYAGALAEEQLLYEDEEVKITLCFFGNNTTGSDCGYLCYENLSDQTKYIEVEAVSVNGITIDEQRGVVVLPGCRTYESLKLSGIRGQDIYEIESMRIVCSVSNRQDFFGAVNKTLDLPVVLKEKGEALEFMPEGNVIFDEAGVKVILNGYGMDGNTPVWDITAINNNDYGVALHIADEYDNENMMLSISKERMCAKDRIDSTIRYVGQDQNKPLTDSGAVLKLHILDFHRADVLHYGKGTITLKPEEIADDSVEILWKEGERTEILREKGCGIYLRKAKTNRGEWVYAIEVENNSSAPVMAKLDDVVLNDSLQMKYGLNVSANPGETKMGNGIQWRDEIMLGVLDDVQTLEGTFSLINTQTYDTVVDGIKVAVTLEGGARIENLQKTVLRTGRKEPVLGAIAEEQILWETDDVCVTLMKLYKDDSAYPAYICYENRSSEAKCMGLYAVSVNGVTIEPSTARKIMPGKKLYKDLYSGDFSYDGMEEIESISMNIAVWNSQFASGKPDEYMWADVMLSQKGKAETFTEKGKKEIFNQDGIRIFLDEYKVDGGSPSWYVTIINDRAEDVYITAKDGEARIYCKVGAKQRAFGEIYHSSGLLVDELSFRVAVSDFYDRSKTIFEGSERTTVYAEKTDAQ